MAQSSFLNQYLVFLLGVPCVITFLLFAWDKHLAYYKRTRVPEIVLLLMSFLMGAFGALCAMIFFNHKTRHLAFTITVPVLTIIQLAAIVLCKTLL